MIFIFCLLITYAKLDHVPQHAEQYMEDLKKCENVEHNNNPQLCWDVILETPDLQCCLTEFIDSSGDSNITCFTLSSIESAKIVHNEQAKAISKEIAGFTMYGFPDSNAGPEETTINVKITQKYTCKDGEISIDYGNDEYTSEEIRIFKAGTHCLNYYFSYNMDLFEKPTSKEDCFNAKLLDSDKNVGIECSYFDFFITYIDGTKENYITCYIYISDSLRGSTIDPNLINTFDSLASTYSFSKNKAYKSYTVDFYDTKGSIANYNSMNGKSTISNPNSNNSDTSYIIYISKWLILLLLISF